MDGQLTTEKKTNKEDSIPRFMGAAYTVEARTKRERMDALEIIVEEIEDSPMEGYGTEMKKN